MTSLAREAGKQLSLYCSKIVKILRGSIYQLFKLLYQCKPQNTLWIRFIYSQLLDEETNAHKIFLV